jgi:hypothetical protein
MYPRSGRAWNPESVSNLLKAWNAWPVKARSSRTRRGFQAVGEARQGRGPESLPSYQSPIHYVLHHRATNYQSPCYVKVSPHSSTTSPSVDPTNDAFPSLSQVD